MPIPNSDRVQELLEEVRRLTGADAVAMALVLEEGFAVCAALPTMPTGTHEGVLHRIFLAAAEYTAGGVEGETIVRDYPEDH